MRSIILLLVLSLASCVTVITGSDPGSGADGSTTTSSASGGGAGGTVIATSSLAGGEAGGATASGGAEGGDAGSGGACIPSAKPCGAHVCGSVDDGCGTQVECGTCAAEQVCTPEGQCCAPRTCDEYPTACNGAMKSDACGGVLTCGDSFCGDGLWMACKGGTCSCLLAANWPPGDDIAQAACESFMDGSIAYYCGAESNEAPPSCVFAGAQVVAAELSPYLWCCY